MSDRMAVVIKVFVALAAIEAVWKLGGALGSLREGHSPWPYLDDAVTITGLIFFALLYLRERDARRKQVAPRG